MANEMGNPQSGSSGLASAGESRIQELELQLEQQRQTFGQCHIETQEAEHELSIEYQFAGNWEKAEEVQRRIINIRKKELGDTHPDTLRSMLDLAPITYATEGGEAGDAYQLDILAMRERALGASHEDTLESVEQLAIAFENGKQYDKALPLYLRLVNANTIARIILHLWTPPTPSRACT
jgi:tetratricopeptide (TPR) repeat protein